MTMKAMRNVTFNSIINFTSNFTVLRSQYCTRYYKVKLIVKKLFLVIIYSYLHINLYGIILYTRTHVRVTK